MQSTARVVMSGATATSGVSGGAASLVFAAFSVSLIAATSLVTTLSLVAATTPSLVGRAAATWLGLIASGVSRRRARLGSTHSLELSKDVARNGLNSNIKTQDETLTSVMFLSSASPWAK